MFLAENVNQTKEQSTMITDIKKTKRTIRATITGTFEAQAAKWGLKVGNARYSFYHHQWELFLKEAGII